MIDLLAPAGLLGLLALALPALLHLRRPPPPTVRLGSLRHLDALPRRRPRWWRWRDRVRLALRLALLTALTFVLARPLWRPAAAGSAPRRLALVDPAAAPAGPSRDRLDARRTAGDEVCLLSDGFPELPSGLPPRPDALPPAPVDVWSLCRELDARLPAGSSLTVFSPARLDSLRGTRPTLARVKLDWVETPPAVATRTARPDAPETRPDGRRLQVLIFHSADRAEDARRLAAAVRAAAPPGGLHPEAVILLNPARDAAPSRPDWVFSLGGPRPETPVETGPIAGARNLFTDAGDAPPTDDGLAPGPLVAPELAGGPPVLVRQRVAAPTPPAAAAGVWWTDSVGRPVLTVDAATPGTSPRRWRFASRFDPAWNDLTATDALAEVLRAWFFPESPSDPPADRRVAGAEQARPREGMGAAGITAHPSWPWSREDGLGRTVNLRPWMLALATAGFLLDRFWAFRRGSDRRASPVTLPG